MNRLTKGALAALATMSIAVAGCQEQGADESVDIDAAPSMDMTDPSMDMTDPSMEASPSDDA